LFENKSKFSFGEKLPQEIKANKVGPFEYSIKMKSVKKAYPNYTFGYKTEVDWGIIYNTPSPGDYERDDKSI
jgi:hypothetical protein